MFGFLSLNRDWERDQHKMAKGLVRLFGVDNDIPVALLIFPEGTVNNDETRAKSTQFA